VRVADPRRLRVLRFVRGEDGSIDQGFGRTTYGGYAYKSIVTTGGGVTQ
jgi:hypothetical protein